MKTYSGLLPQILLKYKKGNINKIKITQSSDIFKLAKELLNTDTVELTEEFLTVFINRINNTIGWMRVSIGGMNGTVADPRIIFITALQCGAHGILCIHNHPSGGVKPSDADIILTKKIKEGGKLLDIEFLDHLIISGDMDIYYSFADEHTL